MIDKVLLPHCTLGVEDLHELALVTGHRLSLQVKDVVLVVNAQDRQASHPGETEVRDGCC